MHSAIKKKIWVERLSTNDIVFYVIHSFFVNILVIYDEYQIYPSARRFLCLMSKVGLGTNFRSANLMLLDKKDSEGKTLRYKVYEDVDNCASRFVDEHFLNESKRFKNTLKSYIANYLDQKIIFVVKVKSEIEIQGGQDNKKNIIQLNRNHVSYLVCEFYRNCNFVIKERASLIENLKFYFRPIFFMAILFIGKITRPKIKENFTGIKPSVWIEFYPTYLHTFWFDALKSQEFSVITYLDRPDTPVTKERVLEIESKGIKWVDAGLLGLIRKSRLNLLEIFKLFREIFFVFAANPFWFGVFRFEYNFLFFVYKSVFSNFKVRVLIQHQEASWKQEIQAKAIESAGGIMLGYHWSCYTFYPPTTHLFPQHVYFVWGKMMYDFMQKRGASCDYILPAGLYIIPNHDKVKQITTLLKNVNFIISIFDDEVPYCGFQTPSSLTEFYLKLFSIIKDNFNFGGIIKSKQFDLNTLNSLPQGEQIIKIANKLIEEKRLVFLEPTLSPLEAALSSNLSVGYCVNSACVVAAINGNCAAIQWDAVGLLEHPFYKDSEQKFIFSSLDELEDAILCVSRGDKKIGNYSQWKKYICYFDDFSAVKRMASFIESFMEENMKTKDYKQSLDFSVNKYIEENKIEPFFAADTKQ